MVPYTPARQKRQYRKEPSFHRPVSRWENCCKERERLKDKLYKLQTTTIHPPTIGRKKSVSFPMQTIRWNPKQKLETQQIHENCVWVEQVAPQKISNWSIVNYCNICSFAALVAAFRNNINSRSCIRTREYT